MWHSALRPPAFWGETQVSLQGKQGTETSGRSRRGAGLGPGDPRPRSSAGRSRGQEAGLDGLLLLLLLFMVTLVNNPASFRCIIQQ